MYSAWPNRSRVADGGVDDRLAGCHPLVVVRLPGTVVPARNVAEFLLGISQHECVIHAERREDVRLEKPRQRHTGNHLDDQGQQDVPAVAVPIGGARRKRWLRHLAQRALHLHGRRSRYIFYTIWSLSSIP